MSLKSIYDNINKTSFYVCLLSSIALLVASFVVPPLGIIDNSVLTAVGEIFGFAALGTVMTAILKNNPVRLTHKNTEISINDPSEKKESDSINCYRPE